MAQMTFQRMRRPTVTTENNPNPGTDQRPPLLTKPPTGRPPDDFGMSELYAKPAVQPVTQPIVNDGMGGIVAKPPQPMGGLTATRPPMKPYGGRRRDFR